MMNSNDLSVWSDDETVILYAYYRNRKNKNKNGHHNMQQSVQTTFSRMQTDMFENKNRIADNNKKDTNIIRNIANNCRICNGNMAFISILENFDNSWLAKEIYYFTNVLISKNDKYSKYMCKSCMDILMQCISFRDMCHKTNRILTSTSCTGNVINAQIIYYENNINSNMQHQRNTELINIPTEPNETDQFMVDHKKGSSNQFYNNTGDNSSHSNECWRMEENKETDNNDVADNLSDHSSDIPSPSFSHPNTRICNTCSKIFDNLNSYKTHLPCCKKGENPPKEKKQFLCDVCGKTTTAKATLFFHRAIHFDVFPFKCDKCPYRGRTRSLLMGHYKSHISTSERSYTCPHCAKISYSKSNLSVHINRVHGNTERTIKCPQCDKMFKFKDDLKRHIDCVHSNSGNTKCEVCHKIYRHCCSIHVRETAIFCIRCIDSNYELKKHIRKHMRRIHKIQLEKPNIPNRAPSYILCNRSKAKNQDTQEIMTS